MSTTADDLLAFVRQHYPTAKRTPDGWILLPNPQVLLRFREMLPLSAAEGPPPQAVPPEGFEDWDIREVWEDHWLHKRAVISSRLLSLLGETRRIYGRQTEARRIDQPTAKAFMDEHHILGGANAKVKLGLFYKEELVAAATFSGARKMPREGRVLRSVELIRSCSKLGTTVVGGISKLLKAYVRELQPDDLMTYVGRDWGEGEVYLKLGFVRDQETPPEWLWVDPATGRRQRYTPGEAVPEGARLAWYPGNVKYVKLYQ